MGMFTKLFNKSHDPYELKGRWYKMTISAGEDSETVIESDIPPYVQSPNPPSATSFFYTTRNRTLSIFGCIVPAVIAVPTENSNAANYPLNFETKYMNAPSGGKMKTTDISLLGDGTFVYYIYGIK